MPPESLSDEQLVSVLQDYLALLQRHASAEEMLERVVTPDFETGYAGGRRWSGEDGLRREEYTGRCFHVWRVHPDGFDWRVASQLVERFADRNPSAEREFVSGAPRPGR